MSVQEVFAGVSVRIEADLLIPGRGDPVEHGTVVLDGPTIRYAGPTHAAPPTPDAEVVTAPVVMPGMWECHGHFVGARSADLVSLVREPVARRAMRVAGDAEAVLRAGFTSVREAGGLGVDLAPAVEEGTVVGPTVHAAGAILSTTGGHGDLHELPIRWVHEASAQSGELHVCDGVAECIRGVRLQLRRNARVIKVCASGGVLSDVDDPIHQQFRDDELRAIVETAGLAERAVMAHCHGKPGIMAALDAGVTTIEHGTYLDDEACAAMVEAGAILVPTRFIVVQLLAAGRDAGLRASSRRKLAALADTHAQAVARAHEAGVRIALGTDIFASGAELPAAWGANGAELELLVETGMTPLAAIEAATANGPATLGPQAPASGRLEEGCDADVITVAADPLAGVSVLADPDQVTTVFRRGERVKG